MQRYRASLLAWVPIVFSGAWSPLCGQDGSLTLVTDGKSDYVIVRPSDSSPSQIHAAEELRDFVKEMTGAELPIVTDDTALPAKAILLGWTKHTERAVGQKIDLASLGDDGFSIRACPPHLAIVGSNVRGTLYGVYELLERYGGCRWYASYFSTVPNRKTWTIPLIQDTQIPAFVMREPFWWDMFNGDFAARCRANGNRMQVTEKHGGKIRFGSGMFVHTFYRIMSPDEFFADHPEYFSEIDGKRVADHAQLCLMNPDVVRIMTERVLEAIRKDPTAKLFSVSQNDWRGYCTCEKCRAIDEREGSPSGTLIHFVNQVAEAVEKEFPDAWIETLAYQYTRTPPKTLRPRHNVVPRLCTIECDFSLPIDVSPCPQNVKFVEDIKGWSAITDKLYIWDYTTNFGHYIGPHPNFACLQGNVKFFRDHKVVGLFEQGAYQSPHAEFAELRAWVLAKLLWNPDQDVEALYADFFNGYYGPAAKPIRTYFDELQALTKDPEQQLRIWSPMTSPWYTDEFFERAATLWAEAERLVQGDEKYRYNVRMGVVPVLYARLERCPKMDVRHVWRDGVVKAEGADPAYAALAAELLARIREGKITHICEGWERHAAFVAELRGLTEGLKPIMVQRGPWQAGVVAEMGGRVSSLAKDNGPNFIHMDAGGVDFANNPHDLSSAAKETYAVKKHDQTTVDLTYEVRSRYLLKRTVEVLEDGLAVTTAMIGRRTQEQEIRPVLRVALDLGGTAGIVFRTGSGTWQNVNVPGDCLRAAATLLGPKAAERDLLIASAATGRGVQLRLPGVEIERVWMLCDTESRAVRVFIMLPSQVLDGGATKAFRLELHPQDAISDLPKIEAAADHRPDRLVVEECLMRLSRRGVWGDIVADEQAEDGFAAKLFNTHYEWCLQWPVNTSWIEPGAQYKVRMRMRVEKADREGEAFWAGVYDIARKTGHGQIQPKTTDVKDGYQWYDVATWKPEEEQYLWVGPGRFDKDGGTSAINALYVDCFELTRVR